MINLNDTLKYQVKYTSDFKKKYRRIKKQGKDIKKLIYVLSRLANGLELEEKYRDHALQDDKHYKGCRECHIESDWLLVYKYNNNELILVLVNIGSHSELF